MCERGVFQKDMNFGFGSSKPKKVKIAAKPPGAENNTRGGKLVRVNVSTLLVGPKTKELWLLLILTLISFIILLIIPRIITIWNIQLFRLQSNIRIQQSYRINDSSSSSSGSLFRSTTKKNDLIIDPKSTLFSTTSFVSVFLFSSLFSLLF